MKNNEKEEKNSTDICCLPGSSPAVSLESVFCPVMHFYNLSAMLLHILTDGKQGQHSKLGQLAQAVL